MTEKRFEVIPGGYDSKWDIRIADLHRIKKTKKDFWNDTENRYNLYEYYNYLYDNNAFLTVEEAEKILNELAKEKEKLQNDATVLVYSNQDYRKENEQLQTRNTRQANTIDELYNLIEKKDWETLQQIIQNLKDSEKQLQKEWSK